MRNPHASIGILFAWVKAHSDRFIHRTDGDAAETVSEPCLEPNDVYAIKQAQLFERPYRRIASRIAPTLSLSKRNGVGDLPY